MSVSHSHPQRRSARAIKGTPCDGCRCMCVIARGRKIRREDYWCEKRHGRVDPHSVECGFREGER